jgi:hypothetical protein
MMNHLLRKRLLNAALNKNFSLFIRSLDFFVSVFYQEKKERRVLSNRLNNLRSKCLIQ